MTYRALTDGELSGAVVKERVGLAYRDNPQGIMDGDTGTSQISWDAMSKAVFSTSGSSSSDVEIVLQPYSVFPCLWMEHVWSYTFEASHTDSNDPDIPRFRLRLHAGTNPPYDYAVTCWYLTDPANTHTWTSIANGAFDQDSPGKGTVFKQLRDNVYAWAENATSAPTPIAGRDQYKSAIYSTSGVVPASAGVPNYGSVTIQLQKGAFFPSFSADGGLVFPACGIGTNPDDPDIPQFSLINEALLTRNYAVAYRTWDTFVDNGNWTTVTDSMLADGMDFTTGLAVAFRENIEAVPRGADNAPRLSVDHVQTETQRYSSTSNANINFGAYPFFPMLYNASTSRGGIIPLALGAQNPDGPYFQFTGATSGTAFNVRRIKP